MPLWGALPLTVAIAYLLGSIPFPHLVGRLHRVDITSVGTGIPGAANVFRTLGPAWGVAVFLGDASKGAAAVLVARALGIEDGLAVLPGFTAVVGHSYPLFARFRGGGGLATAVGAGLPLAWLPGLISLACAVLVLRLIRSTGHAAAVGFTLFAILSLSLPAQRTHWPTTLAILLMAIVILLRATLRDRLRRRQRNPAQRHRPP